MTMTMTHTPIDLAALKAAYAKIGRHTVSPEIGTILDAAAELIEAVEERDAAELRGRIAGLKEAAEIARTAKTLRAWLPTGDNGKGESEHATVHGAEIADIISARLASLQPEVAKREEGE